MKNGLVLLLLMVALVAMTVSAGAMAPVIGQLPAVIVGGADTVDQATTDVHLLRYVNVFNLADPGVITRRTNPDNVAKLAVWYTVDGGNTSTLKISNKTALVGAMSGAEATALTTAGTRPTGKKVNTASDTWLSLIEDVPGGLEPIVTAAGATVDANGVASASLTSVAGKKRVALYAVDVDTVTTAVGTGGFDVYSLLLATDGLSPRTNCASGTTEAPAGTMDGWLRAGGIGHLTTPNSVGFAGRQIVAGTYQYSTWGKLITPAINPIGMIYEAKATLEGSAANGIQTPGYRLWFIANLGVHSGGTHVVTKTGFSGVPQNVPKTGAPKEVRAYWSAPRDLVDMEDGGFLATVQNPGSDDRAYGVQFDMVQEEVDDYLNTLMMTAFNLDLIPRPVNVVPTVKWGDGARNMNETQTGGVSNKDGFLADTSAPTGFASGFASAGYANITLGMGSGLSAYAKLFPYPADLVTDEISKTPAWASGQLIRTTYVLEATALTATAATCVPSFRLQSFPVVDGFLLGTFRCDNVFQYDYVRTIKPSVTHPIMSGTPKAAGSTVECYTYTHVAPAIAKAHVFPQFDVVQTNRSTTDSSGDVKASYAANWNGWGKPGNLVITSIAMEVLNPYP